MVSNFGMKFGIRKSLFASNIRNRNQRGNKIVQFTLELLFVTIATRKLIHTTEKKLSSVFKNQNIFFRLDTMTNSILERNIFLFVFSRINNIKVNPSVGKCCYMRNQVHDLKKIQIVNWLDIYINIYSMSPYVLICCFWEKNCLL